MPGPGAQVVVIQDEGGQRATVTGGKLDVNASISGSGGDGSILDGATPAIKATVLDTLTQVLLATDNPLLVRALIGDESAICDLIAFTATGYDPSDVILGARNFLLTFSMIAGYDAGANNTSLRPAAVLASAAGAIDATNTPLLVRAILGDESAIADLLAVGATSWIPDDVTPGARNLLLAGALIYGPQSGTNNNIRAASVLDGVATEPAAADNPLLVKQASLSSPTAVVTGPVTVATATATDLVASNPDRIYVEIRNPEPAGGEDLHISLGADALATSFAIPPQGTWYMARGQGIFTGRISCYQASGSGIEVEVLEF